MTFREGMIMILATGMMYGGASFVLIFDSPVYGIAAAAANFLFWTWVSGFFVFFGKNTVFGPFGVKKRLTISLLFWLAFCSKKYKKWIFDQLGEVKWDEEKGRWIAVVPEVVDETLEADRRTA